jgi:hypothetical protein
MSRNLLVSVLGNRNSGKSHTWNTLFNRTVNTGKRLRKLYLTDSEYVEVFLVSGSPEEKKKYVGKIITIAEPRIVLCSIQYRDSVMDTIDYFYKHDYFLFVHWLNPGHNDHDAFFDSLGLIPRLLSCESLIGIRDGKTSAESRVQEMRDFIYGWASSRHLLCRD